MTTLVDCSVSQSPAIGDYNITSTGLGSLGGSAGHEVRRWIKVDQIASHVSQRDLSTVINSTLARQGNYLFDCCWQ